MKSSIDYLTPQETDEHLAGRLRQAVKEVEALMSALERRGYIVFFPRQDTSIFLSAALRRPLDVEISKTVRL